MKIKTIILSMLTIFLVIIVGFYVKNLEQSNRGESKIQSVIKSEVEKNIQKYIYEWKGETIPSLNVIDSSGNEIYISNKRDKSTVYVVWASWCLDCQRELPILNKMYNKFKEEIDFISISLIGFRNETIESARDYYNKSNFKFPVFFDKEQEIYNVLNIQAVPTVYLVNKDGVIEEIIIESIGETQFSSILQNHSN